MCSHAVDLARAANGLWLIKLTDQHLFFIKTLNCQYIKILIIFLVGLTNSLALNDLKLSKLSEITNTQTQIYKIDKMWKLLKPSKFTCLLSLFVWFFVVSLIPATTFFRWHHLSLLVCLFVFFLCLIFLCFFDSGNNFLSVASS